MIFTDVVKLNFGTNNVNRDGGLSYSILYCVCMYVCAFCVYVRVADTSVSYCEYVSPYVNG